jgi:cytosine/adenosine deaminase-related metal-dependent hydrolase
VATFFSGGTIWCGVGCIAETVRIESGVVVEINGRASVGDEVIDLQGAFLAPAFMDGHAHPLFGGREAQGPLVNGLQIIQHHMLVKFATTLQIINLKLVMALLLMLLCHTFLMKMQLLDLSQVQH